MKLKWVVEMEIEEAYIDPDEDMSKTFNKMLSDHYRHACVAETEATIIQRPYQCYPQCDGSCRTCAKPHALGPVNG